MHAINLLTRLNWEARAASSRGHASVSGGAIKGLVNELAEYLLFVGEQPPSVPLTARPGFAERLESRTPKDRLGRSFGQLDLVDRLVKYPCSYMVYSEAFDALPPAIKDAVRPDARRPVGVRRPPSGSRVSAVDRRRPRDSERHEPDFPRP
jgi:hypothetical protein